MHRTAVPAMPATPMAVSRKRARAVRACQSCSAPLRRRSAHMARPTANDAPISTDWAWVSVPK